MDAMASRLEGSRPAKLGPARGIWWESVADAPRLCAVYAAAQYSLVLAPNSLLIAELHRQDTAFRGSEATVSEAVSKLYEVPVRAVDDDREAFARFVSNAMKVT